LIRTVTRRSARGPRLFCFQAALGNEVVTEAHPVAAGIREASLELRALRSASAEHAVCCAAALLVGERGPNAWLGQELPISGGTDSR
jgi:hypothetical protein